MREVSDIAIKSLTRCLPPGNILPNRNVAPALLAHQLELEKSMLERDLKVCLLRAKPSLNNLVHFIDAAKTTLQEKLSHRPEPQEVIKKGILKRINVPPSHPRS
jgi:hypothetical protein